MLETVKPRFFIPVHGETRHQHLHARLAQESGLQAENIFILKNGAAWLSDGETAWLGETVPAEDVYVDGLLVGDIGAGIMRDREQLSQDGFVVVTVPVDKYRRLVGEPRILSRGFLHMEESGELMKAAQAAVKRDLRRNGNSRKRDHDETVQKTLQNFFYRETQSRPVILSNIVKV